MSKTDEIESWVHKYANSMLHFAFIRVSETSTAQDIVQETFLAAVQSYENYEHRASPKTWLYSILRNKIADYQRKRILINTQNESEVNDDYFDSFGNWKDTKTKHVWDSEHVEPLDNLEFKAVLDDCMNNLPTRWLSILKLKFYSDLSTSEICETLEISSTNFWQLMYKAKNQLRNCLSKKWFHFN